MRPLSRAARLALSLSLGDLPSAGDTSCAGVAPRDDARGLVTWYSGDVDKDEGWALGRFDTTVSWQGTLDFTKSP